MSICLTKAFEGGDDSEEIEELDPLEDTWLTLPDLFHQTICNNLLFWVDITLEKKTGKI